MAASRGAESHLLAGVSGVVDTAFAAAPWPRRALCRGRGCKWPIHCSSCEQSRPPSDPWREIDAGRASADEVIAQVGLCPVGGAEDRGSGARVARAGALGPARERRTGRDDRVVAAVGDTLTHRFPDQVASAFSYGAVDIDPKHLVV